SLGDIADRPGPGIPPDHRAAGRYRDRGAGAPLRRSPRATRRHLGGLARRPVVARTATRAGGGSKLTHHPGGRSLTGASRSGTAHAVIALRDVTKSYRQGQNDVRALDGVTFDIEPGAFVSIMGPSGSGKSTLLHLMGGLDMPTSGEIIVEGTAISRMSDDEITIFRRRRIGFV